MVDCCRLESIVLVNCHFNLTLFVCCQKIMAAVEDVKVESLSSMVIKALHQEKRDMSDFVG